MNSRVVGWLSVPIALTLLATSVPVPGALAGSSSVDPLSGEPYTGILPAWAASLSSPSAAQTLPLPYLSDRDVADAPYGYLRLSPPPALDGLIAPGEYAHSGRVRFHGYGGVVEAFLREDGAYLYIAFDVPLLVSAVPNYIDVYLDTDNDRGALDGGDCWLRVREDGVTTEYTATTGTWVTATSPVSWTAAATTTLVGGGWQAEFRIRYDKLGVTPGVFRDLGLALGAEDGGQYYWPSGAQGNTPNTWGHLVSSSNWSTMYWKPGPWEDYAPSGMPDFDQRKSQWVYPTQPFSSHCGPVAVANSLWWFDSKFETPDHSPATHVSDTYRLVWSYAGWDDHDVQNVTPLVDDLANNYFNTNDVNGGGAWVGTRITDMYSGTLTYLRDHGLWDDYIVTLAISPSFDYVADEVLRSEDVILLLGFYEWRESESRWVRVGGHYVNVAGANVLSRTIAFSDPFLDNAEQGAPGRVLSGTLTQHYPPHPGTVDPTVHDDAGNVSHDIYAVITTTSPGGVWGPKEYPVSAFESWFSAPTNPHPWNEWEPWIPPNPISVEVEFALTVSPFSWKASGYWEGPFQLGNWNYFQDYAPSGVPDIDQRQDNWRNQATAQWTFCGPVAMANSLWWFDSKFEPQPVGPPLPPPLQPPIPPNDNYPLVTTYDPTAPRWDDHDPLNVDDPATSWGGGAGGEFVEDLATRFQTDVGSKGTDVHRLYTGTLQYLMDHGLRRGYVVTEVESPDFWWVAEEVERSEDVILLLGFWQWQGEWIRLGGHYVTLAGINKVGGFAGFSDPWFDRIEQTWPYAGPGSLAGWPSYLGRVGRGWLVTHTISHTGVYTLHNDTGNVSHDVYNVVGTDSPGGVWGPEDYVDLWLGDIENFYGVNQPADPPATIPGPVQTEVDWAVAVSPVADLGITKTVTPTVAAPGDWLTMTITFSNAGSLAATDVVISDVIPSSLINVGYAYTLNYVGALVAHDTYTWTVGRLRWNEGGVITVTGQVDPGLSWSHPVTITNVAAIATTSQEQNQVPPLSNVATASFAVRYYGIDLQPASGGAAGLPGSTVTYTLLVNNTGNVTDTYGITGTVSGQPWTTTLPLTVGPVAGKGSGPFQVAVEIPPLVLSGQWSRVVVTATSQGSGSLDTSVLTTTAYSPITRGVTVAPSAASGGGDAGETVTYTLRVTNTGNVTDMFSLSDTSPATWTITYEANPLSLGGGAGRDVGVYVGIPSSISSGITQAITVTATSQGDSNEYDRAVLTTWANYRFVYLPLVMRNYP